MNNQSSFITLHPFTVLMYTGTLFIMAMIWSNPLWIGLLLVLIAVYLWFAVPRGSFTKSLITSISIAIIFGLVNALFSHRGDTILWVSPAFLCIGKLQVSLEALLFGLNSGLKIIASISIFYLYGALICQDDATVFFSRVAPKSAVTMTLATLLIPRLRRDMARIHAVMQIRGARFDARGLLSRINASRPLLHILLVSALECSWDIASTLTCRAFGSGPRSYYRTREWSPRDWLVCACAMTSLSLCIIGIIHGRGSYSFYPTLDPLFREGDIPFIAAVFCLLTSSYLIGWSPRQWHFLKSMI